MVLQAIARLAEEDSPILHSDQGIQYQMMAKLSKALKNLNLLSKNMFVITMRKEYN